MGDLIDWLWRNIVSPTPPPLVEIPQGIPAVALAERLGPLLLLRARDAAIDGSIPRDDHAALTRFFSAAYRHTLRLLDGAETLVSALRVHGIEPVLLKGAAHVLTVYAHPGARPMQDIDLLVRPAAFHDAIRIACEIGFRVDAASCRDQKFADSVTLRSGEIAVDLHERLSHRLEHDPDLSGLFDRTVLTAPGTTGGQPFRVFAPEDAALHTVYHIVHHGFSLRLIAFADLARTLAAPGFRWALFASELRRFRLLGVARVVLSVLDRNLGTRFVAPLGDGTKADVVAWAIRHLVDPQTGRARVQIPDPWGYALVTRPTLDGPFAAMAWLVGRGFARLKRRWG